MASLLPETVARGAFALDRVQVRDAARVGRAGPVGGRGAARQRALPADGVQTIAVAGAPARLDAAGPGRLNGGCVGAADRHGGVSLRRATACSAACRLRS